MRYLLAKVLRFIQESSAIIWLGGGGEDFPNLIFIVNNLLTSWALPMTLGSLQFLSWLTKKDAGLRFRLLRLKLGVKTTRVH